MPDSSPQLHHLTRILLCAGFVPLPWFLLFTTIGGALAPGYSAISQQGSELTLLPGAPHLMLNTAAIGTGVSFIVFAIGLWLESRRKLALGALCWILFGIAMVSNGLWIMGDRRHGLYAIGIANLIAPALAQLESQALHDDDRALTVTAFVSFCGLLYLWLNLTGNDPHGFSGLTQRIFSSINSFWPAAMAWLLLRSRSAPSPQP